MQTSSKVHILLHHFFNILFLSRTGVLVAKKDFNAPKHEELEVPNLEVIKGMQSLTSRLNFRGNGITMSPEGVKYLREWCTFFLSSLFDVRHWSPCRLHLPMRSSLRHTRRLLASLVLLTFVVLVEKAHTLLLVVIGMITFTHEDLQRVSHCFGYILLCFSENVQHFLVPLVACGYFCTSHHTSHVCKYKSWNQYNHFQRL
jgi:hypothetical protein